MIYTRKILYLWKHNITCVIVSFIIIYYMFLINFVVYNAHYITFLPSFFLSRSNFEHRRAKSSFHISACKEKMAMRKLYLKRRKIYHVRLMYTLYIYLLPFPDNLLINQFPDMVRTII